MHTAHHADSQRGREETCKLHQWTVAAPVPLHIAHASPLYVLVVHLISIVAGERCIG